MKNDLRSMKHNPQVQQMAAGIDPEAIRQVRSAVEQFQGKSEGEVFEELQRMASAERAAGNLSNARIDSIAKMVAPMLNASQQQRMHAIMNQLKNGD